ncbi:F-box protein At5g03970-like [Lolium perenne]|uniref:F-box protein At5g03970-like n=1 Tax=Lolium perenne TaxID=4522 RepID=UPI0021F603F9|nr:uncharacterized protein LOC127303311 [Lolium perenne]
MDALSSRGGGERLLPMDALSGHSAAPPQPLPLPPDDLLLEILLRLPPEPIYLLRATLVSKHWRCFVHDAHFLRRFRAFHGAPPVLGFLNSQAGPPLFVPTSGAFSPPSTMTTGAWWPLDCRHGRALLLRSSKLIVWDLMSGEKRCLPLPPTTFHDNAGRFFNGAVLRATGNDNDDHIGCRSCPFLVAFALTHDNLASVCVYSSETGVWGDAASVATEEDIETYPTALVENTLYWQLTGGCILEFDLDKHSLDVIELPADLFASYEGQILLMPAEDGGIGFAGVKDDLSLHLFSRVASVVDGTLQWTLRRSIDLEKFIPPDLVDRCKRHTFPPVEAIGFAEDADVIFIHADICVYMLHLKSMQFDEVPEKGSYSSIFPYSSFYTAVLPCLLS